ncbi:hypothetical protein M2140_000080 [Clostridiales Family XIII bacterium PM5-7]
MTNLEKFRNEINDIGISSLAINKHTLEPEVCVKLDCEDCLLDGAEYFCKDNDVFIDWLLGSD